MAQIASFVCQDIRAFTGYPYEIIGVFLSGSLVLFYAYDATIAASGQDDATSYNHALTRLGMFSPGLV